MMNQSIDFQSFELISSLKICHYLKLKRALIGFLFGGYAKRKLLNDNPFDKNMPADVNFLVKHEPDFAM